MLSANSHWALSGKGGETFLHFLDVSARLQMWRKGRSMRKHSRRMRGPRTGSMKNLNSSDSRGVRLQHSKCLVDQAADVKKEDKKQQGPELLQVQWLLA